MSTIFVVLDEPHEKHVFEHGIHTCLVEALPTTYQRGASWIVARIAANLVYVCLTRVELNLVI